MATLQEPPGPTVAPRPEKTPAKVDPGHNEQRAGEPGPLSPIAVSADALWRSILRVHWTAADDAPLRDLSILTTPGLRLSLEDRPGRAPRVVPLMDLDAFVSRARGSLHFNYAGHPDPVLVPRALPPQFAARRGELRPGLCWASFFQWSCATFLRTPAPNFFHENEAAILRRNPGLVVEPGGPTPYITCLNSRMNPWERQLEQGWRGGDGELAWKAFGGFQRWGEFHGVVMSCRVGDGFAAGGGLDAVAKGELFAVLIELANQATKRETGLRLGLSDEGLPSVIVINLADEHARVVQGSLARCASDPDAVELRVWVCESLPYLDGSGVPIPDFWMRLLGWVFSRRVEAEECSGIAEGEVLESKGGGVPLAVRKVVDGRMEDTASCDGDEEMFGTDSPTSKSSSSSSEAERKREARDYK